MSFQNVTIGELAVVDFKSEYLTTEMKEWKARHQIPYSMSCARQVWYGTKAEFADFPINPDIKAMTLRTGTDAYAFLLSFAAGFEYKDFSTHNRAQFYEAWEDVKRTMPEAALRFKALMRDIQLDSNLVNKVVMQDFRKPLMELAARDLSGQKKGQQIWIVGNMSRHADGNLSDFTRRLITVTESRQRQLPGYNCFITLTNPDNRVLAAMENEVARMKSSPVNYCYVRSIIKFAPFVDLIEGVEQLDHLYIDLPMGQIPLADDFLIEAWQERKRRDNTMTHMRGSPQDRGLSIEPWTTAALDNYISPEAVRAEVQRRNKVKKELWEEAKVAFDISAALRAQDIKPDKASVFGPSRQISLSASTPAAIETLSAVYGESNVMGTMITDHLPPESDDGEPPGVGVPGQDDGPG